MKKIILVTIFLTLLITGCQANEQDAKNTRKCLNTCEEAHMTYEGIYFNSDQAIAIPTFYCKCEKILSPG